MKDVTITKTKANVLRTLSLGIADIGRRYKLYCTVANTLHYKEPSLDDKNGVTVEEQKRRFFAIIWNDFFKEKHDLLKEQIEQVKKTFNLLEDGS